MNYLRFADTAVLEADQSGIDRQIICENLSQATAGRDETARAGGIQYAAGAITFVRAETVHKIHRRDIKVD